MSIQFILILTKAPIMNIIDLGNKVYYECFETTFNSYVDRIDFKDLVYHYTTQSKLGMILDSKELWLSHIMDMNDPLELYFGIDVIIDILSPRFPKKSIIPKILQEGIYRLHYFNSVVEEKPIFVSSFSELPDDLKQWIHYANNGLGVNIEFVRKHLVSSVKANIDSRTANLLLPVHYFYYSSKKRIFAETIHFEDMIYNFFKNIDDLLLREGITVERNEINMIFDYAILFAMFIKQGLYEQEKEWRLVIKTGLNLKHIKTKIQNDVAQMKYVTFPLFSVKQ